MKATWPGSTAPDAFLAASAPLEQSSPSAAQSSALQLLLLPPEASHPPVDQVVLAPAAPAPAPEAAKVEAPKVPTLQIRFPKRLRNRCAQNRDASLLPEDFGYILELGWKPEKGRYLFPWCPYGRLNNRKKCLWRYFWFAALLNRTLILPRTEEGFGQTFHWDTILDADEINRCLVPQDRQRDTGAGTDKDEGTGTDSPLPRVMSLDQYLAQENSQCIGLGRMMFINSMSSSSALPEEQHGVCPFSTSIVEPAVPVMPSHQGITLEDLGLLRSATVGVLSLGILISEDLQVPGYGAHSAPFALSPGCGDLLSPPRGVRALVDQIIREFAGEEPYAALHLRRGDFEEFQAGWYPSIQEVAQVLYNWFKELNVSRMYVATDGNPTEVENLEHLVRAHLAPKEIVFHTTRSWRPPIHQGLEGLDKGSGGAVAGLIDQHVCARGKAFLGTFVSTFSDEIFRIRAATSTASCYDGTLYMDYA